ncbi:hypothetical protein [Microbacterium abyssi]|uniref:hypothetical protein n=1 Tax=Microbacterium abyssi TaxID=2782166 RepID=UPI001887EFDB|nr:hypothetical protein [Microbacterium sp. A18JL241]
MSTSDQQGNQPLTRKQLREIRLTGATPVIGEEEAAAAAKAAAEQPPAAPLPRAAEPADVPPAPADVDDASAPLTRRQARAQERIRTASVPLVEPVESADAEQEENGERSDDVVSGVPVFAPVPAEAPAEDASEAPEAPEDETSDAATTDADDAAAPTEDEFPFDAEPENDSVEDLDELPVAEPVPAGERPVVSPSFGRQLLGERSEVPEFTPSFDELITTDSGGSHRAPNTLIFTHPGEGSLSGPVASTGEVLITGSYDLPRGMGSQGHAHGTTDGKDIDSVLIDGELPPASSPTPIAASSAVSTIKPAGEVIRPPAPDKGNKLMLTLAITAGGLALLVAAALIVAFTTNVLG